MRGDLVMAAQKEVAGRQVTGVGGRGAGGVGTTWMVAWLFFVGESQRRERMR
jgi:hypothetical protein